MNSNADPLDSLDDAQAAAAFRHLVRHLRHRHDAQNIDLMGLAGFCRNCLSDWIIDAGAPLDKSGARALIPTGLKIALEPGMIQADGLHPTAKAQPMMLDTMWPALKPLLTR